jgi:hypothetical protein
MIVHGNIYNIKNGDVYYLKDEQGAEIAKFEVKDVVRSLMDSGVCSITGMCYQANAWAMDPETEKYTTGDNWTFVARGYFKFDACTSWNYFGEDYPIDGDSYYHHCGPECLVEHLRAHCFLWKLMGMLMDTKSCSCYSDNQELNQIIELMLDGYSIVKEETK